MIKETLLSLAMRTCKDINLYYKNSRLPIFIKKHIAKSKYKKLKKSIMLYKDNTSFINKDLFYDFIKELYLMKENDRHKCFCNKIIKDTDDNFIFCFTYKLNDLMENDKRYYSDVYGKISNIEDSFDISYDLIAIDIKGNKNLIGKYDENTDELLNSLVFFTNHINRDTTTLSYKMLYSQNYFAKLIFDNIYKYIDRYIKNSMRVLEEK